MQKQKGFTLIELVVVIVILGILAAVAAPKFIDISSDARIATLNGVEGALKSGNELVHSKALVAGQEDNDSYKVDADGNGVDSGQVTSLVNGYVPHTEAGINLIFDNSGDWSVIAVDGDTSVRIYPEDIVVTDETDSPACYVDYVQSAGDGVKPTYTLEGDGC
ncbi:prepilin-type N-terminal cleavage/methylation domain-containing protein [Ferrimonas lipolytica]|uniref:Prepilin-type N-terminal cleavage/methylation domain-containing protein n=1 Tax=Ferrimonas lipolytica TaxID=2724191 RepID=A0A6H1UFN4_9GAMM|nr:prepilin-type N-terminal cleavage/methylation domain-containing protein [Ferrimonas lipolytica]QIZ77917.1 prepilin-type N-terminal cleavage/methylation domain-containing protein [Ferrimonas lipolytica]